MSGNEMLVVVGGLFFGYLIITVLMNSKNNKASEKPEQHESSNSSQKKTKNENSFHERADEKFSAKEEYVPKTWYRILEVAESASMLEISTQYKRKIREYHPDKVASLGKELRELAEFKSKEINSAYDFAKKLKS